MPGKDRSRRRCRLNPLRGGLGPPTTHTRTLGGGKLLGLRSGCGIRNWNRRWSDFALRLSSVALGAVKDRWVEDLGDVVQGAFVAGQWGYQTFQIGYVGWFVGYERVLDEAGAFIQVVTRHYGEFVI